MTRVSTTTKTPATYLLTHDKLFLDWKESIVWGRYGNLTLNDNTCIDLMIHSGCS